MAMTQRCSPAVAPGGQGAHRAAMMWSRLLFCLLLLGLAAACRRDPGPRAVDPPPPAGRGIVFQTDWFPQAEHGGYYQALARGYYAEAGLEVRIVPGGPGAGIKLRLARGEVDFAQMRSDDLLVAAARGLPFVLVMASLQHDPQALMVHAASPVRTFRDLAGRTVIASPSMTWVPFVQRKEGIRFDLRPNTYGLGEFLADPQAIQQCLVTSEPFFAARQGREVRTLPLADAGWDSYHGIVARREFARREPALVRAFVAASVRGWQDYLSGDPAPAHALIRARNPEMSEDLLQFSRAELRRRRLVEGDPARGEGIGRIDPARLDRQRAVLAELGLLDTAIGVTDVIDASLRPPLP